MREQTVPIHQEFIALRFAAKNRMIIEHQALAPSPRLPQKEKRRRKPADSAADHHAIVNFPRAYRCGRNLFKLAVANPMSCLHNFISISVREAVIAHASIPGPIILGKQL